MRQGANFVTLQAAILLIRWALPLSARILALMLGAATPVQAMSQTRVAAEYGMDVVAQHLATSVGVDVLKQGGNAAVAVGYALAVVYPMAGNLGVGDRFYGANDPRRNTGLALGY